MKGNFCADLFVPIKYSVLSEKSTHIIASSQTKTAPLWGKSKASVQLFNSSSTFMPNPSFLLFALLWWAFKENHACRCVFSVISDFTPCSVRITRFSVTSIKYILSTLFVLSSVFWWRLINFNGFFGKLKFVLPWSFLDVLVAGLELRLKVGLWFLRHLSWCDLGVSRATWRDTLNKFAFIFPVLMPLFVAGGIVVGWIVLFSFLVGICLPLPVRDEFRFFVGVCPPFPVSNLFNSSVRVFWLYLLSFVSFINI